MSINVYFCIQFIRSEATQRYIKRVQSTSRRISSTHSHSKRSDAVVHGRCESDSHADTIAAGANCIILEYTGKECDVSPYSDNYEAVKNVPIVHAATAWQSRETGQTYILILHEALWMGDSLDHTLFNPNQLRHFGTKVQDNPMSEKPLSIITEDNEFSLGMSMSGTVIYFDSRTPTEDELRTCPHIVLTSPHPWNPTSVTFPKSSLSLEEEMGSLRHVSSIHSRTNALEICEEAQVNSRIFDLNTMTRTIASMKIMKEKDSFTHLQRNEEVDTGTSDAPTLHTFQSTDRHSDVTASDISERWGISLAQANKTIKSTTQRFLRSATLPLSRRYRADRVFSRKTLNGVWSTDTMDGRVKSLDGNRYAQVFANKSYFAKIYPMDSKRKAGDALKLFCQEFGVPEKLTFDGSKEQGSKDTTFMKEVRKNGIDWHISEADLHNQNPVEGVIREIRRKWYRTMVRKRVPRQLWDYGITWVAEIMSVTHSAAGEINGCVPLTKVTGETTDISEYLDFGFYDPVWFKDNAGLSPAEPGRWLGISHRIGRLMCYNILTQRGSVISRSTVQRVTNLEMNTREIKETFVKFDVEIHRRLKSDERGYNGDKPNPEDWSDLLEEDAEFREEFAKVFNNNDIPESDEYTPEVLEDTYLKMEVALPRDDTGPEFARVTTRLRDANGIPIGMANDNPILDTRIYEVEYLDGHKASLAANTIAENMFAQVDDEGNRHVLFDAITDHRVDGSELKHQEAFITSSNGGRRRRETTKGWEILLLWKDGSSSWEKLKDVKESYPVQLAEYSLQHRISEEPAFAWWVPHVLKKRNRIISKVKSKYWVRTHKYGIRIPKSVKEAQQLDRENGDTLWWDAICKEMKNVLIAFEEFDGDEKDLPPGYQYVDCHMIFDIKMGENFRRKARMVAGGHMTSTPSSLTYSSVVSRDSVRIIFTIAALNGLKVLSADIQNAYLTAKSREKIWTIAGPEFGSDAGKKMIIVRALYGLKSSGAAFRSLLAETLADLGYTPSYADPDVWMKPAVKPNGFKYWEYILCYVDDIIHVNFDPLPTMKAIQSKFKFKNDKIEEPDMYLGASMTKMFNSEGNECWAMSSDSYCAALVKNVESVLDKKGLRLPARCVTPLKCGYRPELDCTHELKKDGLQWYQEIIGSLRWAVEIGRVDILLETSLMSSYLALPREGQLEQVLHMVGYLKEHKKMRLMFDSNKPFTDERWLREYDWFDFYRHAKESIPPNMPEARGLDVSISAFVDANLAGNLKDRRSQSGVLIFVNKAPIQWFSKRQASVETSTFGSEFCAMKIGVELVEALRYKLRMFGVPLEGPANIYCDNEAVYQNTIIPESTLKKKHHSIAYHRCREAVAARTVRVAKQGTEKNLADLFTKVLTAARRTFLLERFTY